MKKFQKFKEIVTSDSISKLSKKELAYISGGLSLDDSAGSQTSGTASNPTPCDKTCVCTCLPPIKPTKPTPPPGN